MVLLKISQKRSFKNKNEIEQNKEKKSLRKGGRGGGCSVPKGVRGWQTMCAKCGVMEKSVRA